MADVDAPIGIGRAIVQQVARPAFPCLLNLLVEPFLLPPGEQFRLPLRQIRLHREIGFGEIERRLVVHESTGTQTVSLQRSTRHRRVEVEALCTESGIFRNGSVKRTWSVLRER